MPHIKKKFKVKAGDFVHAGEGSMQIQSTLKTIGYDPEIIRRAAICAYESEMNIVMHGGNGTIYLTVDDKLIIIETTDDGVGIEDIELAFKEGYSTALEEHQEMGFGAGMGLPNIKKNADSIEVNSSKSKGTYLKMFFRTDKNHG
jgi:anti-sigma regulatory factor (Ser/Thr protein kinase)